MTHSLPSRTAEVVNDARSLPALGSLMPMHQVVSPRNMSGKNSSRWSGLP